jgi:hypothetical protein
LSPDKDSFIKTTFSKSALAWLGTLGTLALFIYLSVYNGGYFSLELYASSVGIWALTGLVVVTLWDEVKMPIYAAAPLLALAAVAIWTAVSTSWSIKPQLHNPGVRTRCSLFRLLSDGFNWTKKQAVSLVDYCLFCLDMHRHSLICITCQNHP